MWCPPACDRQLDTFPRAPRSRVALPAAWRLRRRPRFAPWPSTPARPRTPAGGRLRAPLVVSLPHSFSPSGMERGKLAGAASAAPVLAIPPPSPTQAYGTQSQSHRAPMARAAAAPRPAPPALAAPPHQCLARSSFGSSRYMLSTTRTAVGCRSRRVSAHGIGDRYFKHIFLF